MERVQDSCRRIGAGETLHLFCSLLVSQIEMKAIDADAVRDYVRARYGDIAETGGGCCGSAVGSCCGSASCDRQIGYSPEEMASVPEGSNLGLGCGSPVAIASIRPGQTVLDLGSGAGFDCFLAARQLSGLGQVIGVDMTPAMIAKARHNAREGNYPNVEFRLGEIEALPVADNSVDLVISNCVINCRQKSRVFFAKCSGCSNQVVGLSSPTWSQSSRYRKRFACN